MSPELIGILGLVLFLVLMFLKFPVAVAMSVVGLVGCAYLRGLNAALRIIALDFYATFSNYNLLTIAMFVLMGYLACHSGLSSKIFDFAYTVVGRKPGGLAMASVLACTIFGAISGSYAATAAIVGSAAIPEMRKRRYSDALATASIAAGGVIGTLIPPSVTFIIYGIATEQSINKLFMAGIFPGILFMLSYFVAIWIITKRNPAEGPPGTEPPPSLKEIFHAARNGLMEVMIVFIISIGGLFAGFFTPTEAGGVGAAGVLLVALLLRQISWKQFFLSLKDSTKTTVMILFIIAGATVFGRLVALSRMPAAIGRAIDALLLPDLMILLLILAIYIFLGTFLDTIPMVLLTMPIFFPIVVNKLGQDPIWFGAVVVMATCIGALTPPVGANVFVVKGLAKDVPLETIFRGVMPFVAAATIATALVIIFPQIATFLPNLLL